MTTLKNLIIKTSGLGDLLKQGFSELEKIRYVLIYGSIACGKEFAISDIDLLIIGVKGLHKLIKHDFPLLKSQKQNENISLRVNPSNQPIL